MNKIVEINIPCGGKQAAVRVPEKNLLGIFYPIRLEPLRDPGAGIEAEIARGFETTGIEKMASPASKVAIAVTDRTRVTPNKLFLPALLNKLNNLGVPDQNITILIGTGMHAPDSEEDIRQNVGEEAARRVRVINNTPLEQSVFVECGRTSYGTPVQVHREFAGSDIRIVTGNIVPCLMAGWTGGGKTVLPGVASKETIYCNHKLFPDQLEKASRGAMLGVLPPANIVRDDIEQAAAVAGLHMAVNSVLNFDESIVRVLAGPHVEIHREGVNTALQALGAVFPRKADIIIGGADPWGVSLYQGGSRFLQSLDGVINEGGSVIFSCECKEGLYEGILKDVYTRWMQEMPTPEEIRDLTVKDILPPEEGVVLYVFSWIIHKLKCKVVVVTQGMSGNELAEVHMGHALSLQDALDAALLYHGPDAGVAVLPYGTMMLPLLETQ